MLKDLRSLARVPANARLHARENAYNSANTGVAHEDS